MSGSLRKRPTEAFEAIEPPGNAELIAAVVALTALVEALGILSRSEVWLLGLLVFLPGTASALCTVRQTGFVAAWTTLVVTATAVLRDVDGSRWFDRLLLVLFTLVLATTSVYACSRRIRREHEMVRLRSTAAAMQRHILHPLPLVTGDVLVNGVYEPLHEDRLVGGDIYDVVASPWGTRVLIGDVQGKGLAAVGTAFATIGAFREAAHREPTLTALVDALDAAVVRHNSYAEHTGDDERFVTALIIGIETGIEDAQAINCGHISPYVMHEGTITSPSLDSGVPLGLAELASEPTTVGWFPFPRGATLLLSTDGLTETRAPDGTFYPVDERLEKLDLSPTELPQALFEDSLAFAGQGGRHDDVAVLTVRWSPAH